MWARRLLYLGAVSGAVFTFGFSGNPAAAQAEAPPPYPEFTFRRITVPQPGHSGPRINVQIAPTVPDAPASVSAAPDPASGGSVDWFWSVIQPGLPAMPSRFWAAQTLLSAAPEAVALNVPRLSTLTAIAEAHGRDILAASIGTEVSPALALAVIAVESAGRAGAVSSAGAQGLMQLIPATAARFDVADPFDSAQNIAGGIAYLDWLMDEFGGDPILALAAYNAGEGAVTRAGGVPDYAETRAYVPKVVAAWMLARNLCLTPPELPSDGCVFQVMAMN